MTSDEFVIYALRVFAIVCIVGGLAGVAHAMFLLMRGK
jgi:hypothetical protein